MCSGADILILITNLLLSFQHRKSGDQYKMQYIVSMFISILSFSHQSSAQNTFYCNLNFHDFYPVALLCAVCVCPRLLGGGGGRLPALITRRLEAGGRFPVLNIPRNLPRLRNLPGTEQLPLVRRREGEWSSDYHHQPAQPAANNSSPTFTRNWTKYFLEHANIFDPHVKHTNITQSDIFKFFLNEINLQLLFLKKRQRPGYVDAC